MIYGASDDLVEFEGDFNGEVGCFGTDGREKGVLVVLSDGTILEAKYGKFDKAIWEVRVRHEGTLFECRKEATADDEDSDYHSDRVYMKAGIKWAYAATDWEEVR
jgi:hypothetical protein